MAERADDRVPRPLLREKYARMTPEEFEEFVVATLKQINPHVEDLRIELHETIEAHDGTYDFDATVRYRLLGLDFFVVVEAKRYRSPVKREVVQILHEKMKSVGAHKGVVIATAPFQRGALHYATEHGIALVCATGEGFKYEVRMMTDLGWTEEFANGQWPGGFVAHWWWYSDETTLQHRVLTGAPEHVRAMLVE